jgi:hypothetical protein
MDQSLVVRGGKAAQPIRNEAKKRGVSVDEYLRTLAESTVATVETELSEAEVDKILDELAHHSI